MRGEGRGGENSAGGHCYNLFIVALFKVDESLESYFGHRWVFFYECVARLKCFFRPSILKLALFS